MITDNNKVETILELKNISLTNNSTDMVLLDNISLKIASQERIGVIGVSGAGKSTLLKIFNNLFDTDQGEIFWQQRSILDINPLQLRRQVVLVPQEPKLLGMDVRSTLIYPLQLQQLSATEIEQRLSWCLERFLLPQSWLSRYESELSVGQRQLVSIARGVIMYPQILLLDEPTSALDSGKADWLKELLIDLSTSQLMTIVVVNHNLEWIKNFAKRLIWLEKGTIKKDLTIDQVDWKIVKNNFSNINTEQDWDDF